MIGLGVAVCEDILSSKFSFGASAEKSSTFLGKTANEETLALTTAFSFDTSDSSSMPGPMSDVFLVPSFNVKFSKAKEVQLDPGTCQISAVDVTTWALDAAQNKEVAFFSSVF